MTETAITSSDEQSVELVESTSTPSSDVVPLPKSTSGRTGTTKRGKSVTSKSGDPRADKRPAAAPAKSSSTSATTSSKRGRAKPATPSSDAAKSESARLTTFVVRERKSRVTGTTVQIINLAHAASDVAPEGDKSWAARCVDHEHVSRFVTRAAARAVASDPSSWCPKCKRAAKSTE